MKSWLPRTNSWLELMSFSWACNIPLGPVWLIAPYSSLEFVSPGLEAPLSLYSGKQAFPCSLCPSWGMLHSDSVLLVPWSWVSLSSCQLRVHFRDVSSYVSAACGTHWWSGMDAVPEALWSTLPVTLQVSPGTQWVYGHSSLILGVQWISWGLVVWGPLARRLPTTTNSKISSLENV